MKPTTGLEAAIRVREQNGWNNDARLYLENSMRRIGAPMRLGGDDGFGDAALRVLKIEPVQFG